MEIKLLKQAQKDRDYWKSTGNKRANSFAKLQSAFAGCDLTDEEIRQECEIVRQEMQDHAYAY